MIIRWSYSSKHQSGICLSSPHPPPPLVSIQNIYQNSLSMSSSRRYMNATALTLRDLKCSNCILFYTLPGKTTFCLKMINNYIDFVLSYLKVLLSEEWKKFTTDYHTKAQARSTFRSYNLNR